jgi:tetratricopeptide (TPR) repeat protein
MFKIFTLLSLLVTAPFYVATGSAYNYSYYGEAIHSAPGMTFATYLNAQTLGTTLASPEDLVVFEDVIYMIDSDTNHLTLIDNEFNLLTAESTFQMTPEFMASNNPTDLLGIVTRNANDLNWNMNVPAEYSVTTEPSVLEDDVLIFDMVFSDNFNCTNCFLSQEGFAAEQGSFYRISFDAKSDLAKDIDMMFGKTTVNPATYTPYAATETVTLDDDWTSYAFEFEMTEPSTSDEGELKLTLGDPVSTTVYFDNIRLEQITELGGEPIPYTNQVEDGTFDQNLLTFDSPMGLDVTESGIFIADTGNYRIVKLNHDFEVVNIFSDIEDATFDSINFEPEKITVDPTDRMYVVAKNVYEGILEINFDGTFNRFTGVNPIALTPFQIFSRSLMTEEQLDQLQLFLPTEYTNVSIDDRNFIYATSKPSENNDENPIQLINPKGVDVIRKNGYFPPMGDIHYVVGMNNYVIDGPSSLVDIASTDYGIYTVLDQKRSRLFTYDSEGNLLYINGDEGSQSDKFSEGVAISYFGDDLLILDRGTKTIVVYQLTEFGSNVNQAIAYHYDGEFEKAAEVWMEVIKINTNYEIAYNGIGKLLLRQGEYRDAMEYFRLGHDQYYYSKAFREYRNDIIKSNFGWIIGGVVLIGGSLLGYKIRQTYKRGGSILYED